VPGEWGGLPFYRSPARFVQLLYRFTDYWQLTILFGRVTFQFALHLVGLVFEFEEAT